MSRPAGCRKGLQFCPSVPASRDQSNDFSHCFPKGTLDARLSEQVPVVAIRPWGGLLWETEREPLPMETRDCLRLLRRSSRLRNGDGRVDRAGTRATRALGNHLCARGNGNTEHQYLLHYTTSGKGHEQRRRDCSSVRRTSRFRRKQGYLHSQEFQVTREHALSAQGVRLRRVRVHDIACTDLPWRHRRKRSGVEGGGTRASHQKQAAARRGLLAMHADDEHRRISLRSLPAT
jgi:hypothetical protein